MPQSKSSEGRAYSWIRNQLKKGGFNIKNPARDPHGEVFTQHECNRDEHIKGALQGGIPENIVKLDSRLMWVIEAKNEFPKLKLALKEATEDYANAINTSGGPYEAVLASGVAGSDEDGYKVITVYSQSGKWYPVTLDGARLDWRLPRKGECNQIIATGNPNIHHTELSRREVVELSKQINAVLHKVKVTKEKRASTVAILLLALSKSPDLHLGSDPDVFIQDINSRAQTIFTSSGKANLWEQIKLLPPSRDNKAFANALDNVIKKLLESDILSSTPKSDVLGDFFENFLRYGNSAKDIGIVLTPRHICSFVTRALDVRLDDIVYDPALGTGGFLIAGYNHIKSKATETEARRFATHKIYGCEENGSVAGLAFVNMYFRGDGKHNLRNASCFTARLTSSSPTAGKAQFKEGAEFKKREFQAATRVMMNPPFALKDDDEKEYKFVDHALLQMQKNGLLFTVLPSSVMYSGEFRWWREQLLENNRLLSVVLFPSDLFYPVAVESVGVFIKKGVPHYSEKVLWVRLDDDGLTKWKGYRIENKKSSAGAKIEKLVEVARRWCVDGHESNSEAGFYEFRPVHSLELVPQEHMDTPPLNKDLFRVETGRLIRGFGSSLIDIMVNQSHENESH